MFNTENPCGLRITIAALQAMVEDYERHEELSIRFMLNWSEDILCLKVFIADHQHHKTTLDPLQLMSLSLVLLETQAISCTPVSKKYIEALKNIFHESRLTAIAILKSVTVTHLLNEANFIKLMQTHPSHVVAEANSLLNAALLELTVSKQTAPKWSLVQEKSTLAELPGIEVAAIAKASLTL